MTKNLLETLNGKTPAQQPIWLMRQAGRYLPEYRALREKAGSFMKLCLTPEMAADVTLQPVRRFGMDGAILFSDILIVPYALGQKLDFVEGEGPQLETLGADLPVFDEAAFFERSKNIYETLRLVASTMPKTTTLIGFAGSPFTVGCYLLGGKGKDEFVVARQRAYQDLDFFKKLLMRLAEATGFYLNQQIAAGAETVQLFDSWSGLVPAQHFHEWVIAPTRKIVEIVKQQNPTVPVIGFPRGSVGQLEAYIAGTGVNAVSLDQGADLPALQKKHNVVFQGNIDPLLMQGAEKTLLSEAEKLLKNAEKPFIFNLGHGLTPQVPPENVGALVTFVQGFKR